MIKKLFIPPSRNTLSLSRKNSEKALRRDFTGWANLTHNVRRDNPAGSFAKQNWRGQYRYPGLARKVFIFDLDGTLVDAYPAIISSFNFTMTALGYRAEKDEVIKRAVGWGDTKLLEPFVSSKDLKIALSVYRRHHLHSLKAHLRWLPEAKELLVCLKKKDRKVAIASNRPKRFTKIILKSLGAAKFFDKVLCADQLKFGKPNPLILQRLIKALGVSKQDVLYVGDMVIDVVTGKRAGVETAAVSTGSSTLQELKRAKPTYLFKDLTALRRECQRPA
jgi:HAD superfamily hydrolase (TIGR01549 family)